ncbi:MAG: ribose 5-phosphate isomerase A [Planctomycetota bacterium]|nr:ribose 5-phosphate isomerase A [Planctomycetota bacterium]
MSTTTHGHDALAQAAVQDIESDMIVGLGTGLTADRATRALAARVVAEGLSVQCVCTSAVTLDLAKSLHLTVVPFSEVEAVDYLFDGASEVDPQLQMLKGHHGAITRQRLVAEVSARCVYMTTEDRYTTKLGSKALLSATIIPFGIASIRAHLRHIGLSGVLRRTMEGAVVETEGGGVVLDMTMPDRDPREVADVLDKVSGIVDHGLFLDEADEVLIECKNGDVKRIVREE